MTETERWETTDQLAAARERFERDLGWQRPRAWGLLKPDGTIARANVDSAYLPAVILATAVAHTGGTASYPLSPAQVDAAIATAEPAEACTEMDHPNIRALRYLQLENEGAIVVFIAEEDFSTDSDDEHVAALLAEIRRER